MVVLTNGDNASPTPIETAVRTAPGVAAASADARRSPVPRCRSPAGDAYVGTFRNPRRFTVEVVRQGRRPGAASASAATSRCASVARAASSVDLPRGGTETIAFGLGADGRADYLQMNVWALARVKP